MSPGRLARVDPIAAVAAVLIAASVVWRGSITFRGYLTIDDFPMIAQADASGPSPAHFFELYNNHLMPAGRLIIWVTERLTGYAYWPYAALLLLGQIAVGIAFYRLLRLMLPSSWALLVPLSLFLFNPLTLEVTAWWAVGINLLPMQLTMIIALYAHIRYLRTDDRRHLVTMAVAMVVGLLFFEKALFIAPLVFLATLFFYASGSPVRALVTTVRRWWPSWAVLTGISLVYLAGYLTMSTASPLRSPASAGEVGTFFRQFYVETLVPGLLGGPWRWLDAGDGTAITAPSPAAQWLSLVLVALLIGVTIWLRRWTAVRAWAMLAVFSALAGGLIAATRLGSALSGVSGLVPRYLGDVLLVAAICIGVAVCGLRPLEQAAEGADEVVPAPLRGRVQPFVAGLTGAVVLLVASSLYSGIGFAADWRDKTGRDYLNTARADLAVVEAGTVFMDQPVPEAVVPRFSYPWNMQSKFFGPLEDGPVFVTEARKLSVFDQAGHVRPAWVEGVRARPGPLAGCGYRVTGGRTSRIRLQSEVIDYWQVVRISYLSDRDTTATIQVGRHDPRSFDVHRGLNAMFLLMLVEGDEVVLDVLDRRANFCTNEIEIGALVPQPAG